MIKARYDQGMNLLLTRYATFYAVNIGATKDNKNPNNCWLGRTETDPEITAEPWSFFIQGHKSHPAYQGIHEGNSVYTCSKGYGITNTTAQWHLRSQDEVNPWGDYNDEADWSRKHGGLSWFGNIRPTVARAVSSASVPVATTGIRKASTHPKTHTTAM